jgi:putative SOS response-associated peptidase YedK
MCNLYSLTTNVEAIRRLFKVKRISPDIGNMEPLPGIFPGQNAPVIRLDDDGERELTSMHWGFVMPQKGKAPKDVTNARDDRVTTSPFWKSSFQERRCLIPTSSFAEYHPTERNEKGHKLVVWFGLTGDEPRPPFVFAGLWRHWRGNYRNELVEFDSYSIVTTKPNEIVKPIHPTRMPVILKPDDHETWLNGSPEDAIELARPYPTGEMRIMYRGDKADPQA